MLDVINLALPFFGLIFLGFGCGKFKAIPDSGFAWMDFFILYVALPALFYRIVAQTPLEQLANPRFIVGTMLATFCAFSLSFAIGMMIRRGQVAESTIAGLAGGYGNIGYMGPGLALATLGSEATAPVALIFCFDNILLFSLVPFLMTLAGREKRSFAADVIDVIKRVMLHPLMVATMLGVLSAAVHYEPPVALDRLMQFLQNAAAPAALFTLGVTAALMAALPPALNVFVFARQYDVWVEQASSAVLFGTLISVATLTTVMWLVKTQQLPVRLFH